MKPDRIENELQCRLVPGKAVQDRLHHPLNGLGGASASGNCLYAGGETLLHSNQFCDSRVRLVKVLGKRQHRVCRGQQSVQLRDAFLRDLWNGSGDAKGM